MKCPDCSFDNPPTMKFCGDCGAKLPAVCSACGTEVVAGFKFCGQCGEPVARPPTVPAASTGEAVPVGESALVSTPVPQSVDVVPEGEIKHATVLHCELVVKPAQALEAELGAERLHHLMNEFMELARTEVSRLGGKIDQFWGQGFMALFGAPVAFEDHARRGLMAAVSLRRRLSERPPDPDGTTLGARMGLATGEVVIGGAEGVAVGETTHRAERLRLRAQRDEVVVDPGVAAQVRGRVELDGSAAYRVAGHVSALVPSGPRLGTTVLSTFVGRDRELGILEELRDQAALGYGQVVGISGEAGAGKSRLLHEFYQRTFPASGVSYLRGQCLSFGSTVPYQPLIGMIRNASRIADSDDAETVVRKLRESLDLVGTDPNDVLPFFLRLLDVDTGTEALAELEPQTIQSRTFAALRRMLLDASRQTLVVVEVEDLHWIDDTSARFLDSLVEMAGNTSVLLLLTYRSGYQPRWLEKSYATQITMRRLSDEDSRALAAAVLERAGVTEALVDPLLAKAEGNPLFLEELARALTEDRGSNAVLVPNTIQGILMARIDRLPEAHRSLLRTASVLGREFSVPLLTALWDRADAVAPLLRDLRTWEFLYKTPSEDQDNHFFKHALTQEVAYASLLTEHRRGLHRRAAATLEAQHEGQPGDVFDRLIFHYPRAGDPEKAVAFALRFASRAAGDFAHAEAAKALREVLPQAEQLPPETRDRRQVELVLQLAESLLPLACFPETLERCIEVAGQVERLGDPSLSAPYYFWLAHTHTYLGNQDETRRVTGLAIEAARDAGDEATEGKTRYVLGRDGFWSGRFEEGIENSLRAVVLLERCDEPWWQSQAHWVAGFNHYVLGQFAAGIEALERTCSIGEALDDYRLDASWSLGYFHASLGRGEVGVAYCQRGLERAQDPLNTAVAMGFLGHAQLQLGDAEHAIATLRESIERLRDTGMQQILGWFRVFLAEAHLALGQLLEAEEQAEAGRVTCEEAEFRYGVGLAVQTLGRVARVAERSDDARIRLDEALEMFEALAVPFEVGRTRLDRARLARQLGEVDAAAREFDLARALFTKLEVVAYIEQARTIQEQPATRT